MLPIISGAYHQQNETNRNQLVLFSALRMPTNYPFVGGFVSAFR
jgi:hypothetical protein